MCYFKNEVGKKKLRTRWQTMYSVTQLRQDVLYFLSSMLNSIASRSLIPIFAQIGQ